MKRPKCCENIMKVHKCNKRKSKAKKANKEENKHTIYEIKISQRKTERETKHEREERDKIKN
jgi:hypothetical protein